MNRQCLALGDIQDAYIIINRLVDDDLFSDDDWKKADVPERVRLLILRYKEATIEEAKNE